MSIGEVKNRETDGRTKFTEETKILLRQAASLDCTWEECAFYAKISEKTLYEWFKNVGVPGNEGSQMREELEALRNKPVLKARQSLVKGLDDPDRALRYLERKRKSEFSLRQEHTGKDGQAIQLAGFEYVEPKNKTENTTAPEATPSLDNLAE